jgi:hypothetical protein
MDENPLLTKRRKHEEEKMNPAKITTNIFVIKGSKGRQQRKENTKNHVRKLC